MKSDFILGLALLVSAGPAANQAQPTPAAMRHSWQPSAPIDAAGRNGVVLIKGTISNSIFGPATVRGAYRAIESSPGSKLERVMITGLVASDLQRDGIRLRTANAVTIRDFDLSMRVQPQEGKHLPEGIAITAGHEIMIRDGRVKGFRMVEGRGYTNGDGIATEGESSGQILNVTSSDNSDGGFDLKGTWAIDRLTSTRNGRAFRFWNTVTAGTLVADQWRSAAIWAGKGAQVHVTHLIARNNGPAPLLIVAGQSTVVIDRCTLSRPNGAPLIKSEGSNNSVTLGAGCQS